MEHSEAFSLGCSGGKCGGKAFGSMCEQIDSWRGRDWGSTHLPQSIASHPKSRGTMGAWNGDDGSLFLGALKMKHSWVKGMTEWGWVELCPWEGHGLALGVLNGLHPSVATTLPTLGAQGRQPWAPCPASWSCCKVAGRTNQPDLVILNSV